ncbi:Uncharacterized protein dnm_054410 [Desulfonema magnum]|uniref:Uncharacterized protein n=1 Tax=Desulfonema magnum TaxID=45655 RepID=A0A975BPV1_9BACT|nr:Uncharacterized protein dnm_054410 [Desulfonema magnum]
MIQCLKKIKSSFRTLPVSETIFLGQFFMKQQFDFFKG